MPADVSYSSFVTVPAGNRGRTVPLSYQQATYLEAEQAHAVGYRLGGGGFVTNTFGGVRIEGELDDALMHRAVEDLLLRHDALRTRFDGPDGDALQIVTACTTGAVEHVDLSATSAADVEATVAAAAAEAALRPLDRASGLLLRLCVIRVSRVEHVLVFVIPHIVSDSVSMQVVLHDFMTLYLRHAKGLSPGLADLPVQYADFVVWQRQWFAGDVRSAVAQYVDRRLAGARAVQLPPDDVAGEAAPSDGAEQGYSLGGDLCRLVADLSHARKVTPFVILLSAYGVLLSRWSGADDLFIIAPLAGRPDANSYQVVGLFSNPCPLRLDLSGDPPFASLLERVDSAVAEAIRHRTIPYRLLEEIARERGRPLPAFGAATNSVPEGSAVLPRARAGLLGPLRRVAPYVVDVAVGGAARQVRSDLTALFGFSSTDISLRLIYRCSHFRPATIARAARDFRSVLESLAAGPHQRLSAPRLRLGSRLAQRTRARRQGVAAPPAAVS